VSEIESDAGVRIAALRLAIQAHEAGVAPAHCDFITTATAILAFLAGPDSRSCEDEDEDEDEDEGEDAR
jgi:hypothetical protein